MGEICSHFNCFDQSALIPSHLFNGFNFSLDVGSEVEVQNNENNDQIENVVEVSLTENSEAFETIFNRL